MASNPVPAKQQDRFDETFYRALAERMLADPDVQNDPKAPKTVDDMVLRLRELRNLGSGRTP